LTLKSSASLKHQKYDDINSYLETVPGDSRAALLDIREAIRSAAPDAEEAFVYGVPGFKIDGKSLVCYASFKKHCGFYPMSPKILSMFVSELKSYETYKGTIRFFPERPLPKSLVKKIVKARVSEIRGLYQK